MMFKLWAVSSRIYVCLEFSGSRFTGLQGSSNFNLDWFVDQKTYT